jgi:hypothetical protein
MSSPSIQTLIETIPRCLLASVFLIAAQARFTARLTPAFHEYETSKTLRTQQNSWMGVSPWLHQRIVAVPVGLVGLGPLVPDLPKESPTVDPRQLREWSALVAVVLLTMGIVARAKAGMDVRLPASMMFLSLSVAFVEFAPFSR